MNHYEWSKEEAMAIKAAWATPEGRAALNVLIERVGGLQRPSIDDSPIRMAFSEGKRSVAISLASAIRVPLEQLVKEPDDRSTAVSTITERAADAASVAQQLAAGKSARAVRSRRSKR